MADTRSVKRLSSCNENSGEMDAGGQDAKAETDALKAGNDAPNPKKARAEEGSRKSTSSMARGLLAKQPHNNYKSQNDC